MQVILQTVVSNLGGVGDIVNVSSGYARNFLLPKKMALPVTEENKAALDKKRAVLEKEAAKLLAQVQDQAKKMAKVILTLKVQAKETGQLFGSVGLAEIVTLLKDAGHEVDKKCLHIAEGAIKDVGEYNVIVQLHPEVKFNLPLSITADASTSSVSLVDEVLDDNPEGTSEE